MKFCSLRACSYRDVKYAKNVPVSRHYFPGDSKLKKIWTDFVIRHNRQPDYKAPLFKTSASLCSAHFEPSWFKPKKLDKNAIPTIAPIFTPEIALKFGLIPSLDSSLLLVVNNFEICVEEYLKVASEHVKDLEECGHINHAMDVDEHSEDSPMARRHCPDNNGAATDSGSTHAPNGSIQQSSPSEQKEPPHSSPKLSRKRKRSYRYVGDLSPTTHFGTPRRAKASLEFVNRSMAKVRNTLRATQMRLRRAGAKVHDLNSLLQHLKDTRRIPEDVAASIEVIVLALLNSLECEESLGYAGSLN